MGKKHSRIEEEKQVIVQMIHLYCRKKEGNSELCSSCRNLMDYALLRLDKCPFGEKKSTCRQCPVHCYKKDMRERMCEVMRYSGPRMIIYHPLDALRHLFRETKNNILKHL